jgi:hypothetical protein
MTKSNHNTTPFRRPSRPSDSLPVENPSLDAAEMGTAFGLELTLETRASMDERRSRQRGDGDTPLPHFIV